MRTIPVILFGVGGVGRALVRQVVEQRHFHAATYGLHLQFYALCDSDGAVLETAGLGDAQLRELLTYKESGGKFAQHPLGGPQNNPAAIVDIVGCEHTIVVDCTATAETVPALLLALDRGYCVVMANKKPLTAEQEVYDRLTSAGVSLSA